MAMCFKFLGHNTFINSSEIDTLFIIQYRFQIIAIQFLCQHPHIIQVQFQQIFLYNMAITLFNIIFKLKFTLFKFFVTDRKDSVALSRDHSSQQPVLIRNSSTLHQATLWGFLCNAVLTQQIPGLPVFPTYPGIIRF